jgi:hypothetical protein
MKKLLVIFFIVFIIVSPARSAKKIDSTKFSFNISVGAAIPFRNLGINNPQLISKTDSTAYGSAETGFHFDISINWYFSHHIGFAALFGGSINSFNTKAYNSSINFDEPTTTAANNFYLREYLFGFIYRFCINPKIRINLKGMIGTMAANYPNVTVSFPATTTQSAGNDLWTIESSDAFVWCFSAGIKYALRKHLSLTGDLSCSIATIQYPYGTLKQSLQGNPALTISYSTPLYMSLGLLKPTVGVAYEF